MGTAKNCLVQAAAPSSNPLQLIGESYPHEVGLLLGKTSLALGGELIWSTENTVMVLCVVECILTISLK